jgi:hypothetical protein
MLKNKVFNTAVRITNIMCFHKFLKPKHRRLNIMIK